MSQINRIQSVVKLKCPRCGQGNLFEKKGLIVYSGMLDMPEKCSHCGLKYMLEPGFWLGALWTSYPIVVAIELPFLFLAIFSKGNIVWLYFGIMISALFIAYPVMLRLGRSMWIHLNVRREI